ELAQQIVRLAAERVQALRPPSQAHQALKDALMTPAAQVPPATRHRTDLFTAPYWGPFSESAVTTGATTAAS
ncbi:S-methyl-5'-thioadenosine phosphorylase, partial [Cyanobium sp. Cruz CV13-4-11]|nr:S-methyl-5'-thioadenosine phosphorylase [Cyanobium sp. Cruz CV11-17]MCP9919519.1 S-methyl-5'-thioadenosine phosphorylase [Cyanobium sp. Cruz CV13-4-11]